MKLKSVGSFVLVACIFGGPTLQQPAHSTSANMSMQIYSSKYGYDRQGRILSQMIEANNDVMWRIDYIHNPQLSQARVNVVDGQLLCLYQYQRDASGRLISKRIVSEQGIELGLVQIAYDATGSIVELKIRGPHDLPLWDPLVDK
jgi:hypothetical protein